MSNNNFSPAELARYTASDGYVYFDMKQDDIDESLKVTKNLHQLTDINELQLDLYIAMDLPKTEKNIHLLEHVHHPNINVDGIISISNTSDCNFEFSIEVSDIKKHFAVKTGETIELLLDAFIN